MAAGADTEALVAAYRLSEGFGNPEDDCGHPNAVQALVQHAAFVSAIACALSEAVTDQCDYSQALRDVKSSFATVKSVLAAQPAVLVTQPSIQLHGKFIVLATSGAVLHYPHQESDRPVLATLHALNKRSKPP